MNHIEFAASESAALKPSDWERWIARLEKVVGHGLDGDQRADGYSLDFCHDLYEQGKTPLQASYTVLWRKHGLNAAFNATRHCALGDPEPECCDECGQIQGSCICRVNAPQRRC